MATIDPIVLQALGAILVTGSGDPHDWGQEVGQTLSDAQQEELGIVIERFKARVASGAAARTAGDPLAFVKMLGHPRHQPGTAPGV